MPTMAAVARKEGVLKLVHPGGYVEAHRRPMPASEVMAKNPRHWVARPDVFKFPWIVVRPESVLRPGWVFYIVPHRTLYQLLRSYRSPPQRPPPPPAAQPEAVGGRISAAPKSCLKKQESGSPASRGRRVAFVLSANNNAGHGREMFLVSAGGR